ncbi:MAG: preprotein translocase subunit SecG [Candidatus Peribacteraceae bacterium]|nr:preprotein translocase subunit SecG [Candidatus Peribacteraceae bacterium]
MNTVLLSIEVVVAILLSLSILVQQRASGLSQSMGGSGVTYAQRRGAEKVLFQASIVLGVIFFTIPVVMWFTA